jgi:glutathione transport system permease protein
MSNTTTAATVPAAQQNDVRTPATEFWRKFKKQHLAVGAGLFVLLLVIVAVFAQWIVPYDPENYFDYDAINATPSWAHWMGVDSLGRDIFSRIILGAQISLAAGFLSVAMGAVVGTLMGLMAGYYQGWWERITMRISDVLLAFPGMLLAIGVVAILGSSMVNVIVAVAVFSVPAFARLVRGNTLAIKQMTYVEAVRSIGASDWTIIMRHILPGTSIITAASLSFLGMGAQPPTPEWGAMLNEARADMVLAPHVAIFPALAIFLTVLAFNLLGDGLRDALDPKIDRR